MALSDLDLILKKDPVITTWTAGALVSSPQMVEQDYAAHAKTHVALGNTKEYVERIFRWVGGGNKGAFIGAVLGEFGEGKTSFMVHLWEQSASQGILTVPPFEWEDFEQIMGAVAAWAAYMLQDRDPVLAHKARALYDAHQKATIEDLAKMLVKQTGMEYEEALKAAQAMVESNEWQRRELSAARVLDFVAELTDLAKQAGYEGLLVLLDEPEIAAKVLGNEAVSHFFFQLADGLHQRQGDYGFFLSMPGTFYAVAAARFGSLTARLDTRQSFIRLGSLYGNDFARVLWQRYMQAYEIESLSDRIVDPLVLSGAGQSGASSRKDLSYGPRSVVSAFNRIVDRYVQTGQQYSLDHYIDDIVSGEILFRPEYGSRIEEALNSPEVDERCQEAVRYLAAFPDGMTFDLADQLGISDELHRLSRPGSIVRRTASVYSLKALSVAEDHNVSILDDFILLFDDEFVPGVESFDRALSVLADDVVPDLLGRQQGSQLVGWRPLASWAKPGSGIRAGAFLGAFAEMQREYPQRAMLMGLTAVDRSLKGIKWTPPKLDSGTGPQQYDLCLHLALRWSQEQQMPGDLVEIVCGDPDEGTASTIRIAVDLTEGRVSQDYVANLVGADRMSPYWVLNLIERMRGIDLPRESEGDWEAIKAQLLRQLPSTILGMAVTEAACDAVRDQIGVDLSGSPIGGNLLGGVAYQLLMQRYPEYATLIKSPQWERRVDTYVSALQNSVVPLACKRGIRLWQPPDNLAETVFGMSRMNLSGGAFEGYSAIIDIDSRGKAVPLDIRFKTHPLEDAIQRYIQAHLEDGKSVMQLNGKPCPYVRLSDLAPQLMSLGYTLAELNKIVAMGTARQSFEQTRFRGEEVLYTRLLDIAVLKEQCRAKLQELLDEIALFRKLPGYATNYDPEPIQRRIDAMESDTDYDEIVNALDAEFRRNHGLLPGYQENLATALKRNYGVLQQYEQSLATSGLVQQLNAQLPRSVSAWGQSLGQYVIGNLRETTKELQTSVKETMREAGRLISKYQARKTTAPKENLELLLEGYEESGQLDVQVDDLQQRIGGLSIMLKHLSGWRQLLAYSDELFEELTKYGQGSEHKGRTADLLSQFETVSTEIKEHLEFRNVSGLAAYPQFQKKLQEIRDALDAYLRSIRELFEKRKQDVNAFLQQAFANDRVRTQFDFSSPASSYEELFAEGADLFRMHVDQCRGELAEQQRDLLYAADVLGVIADERTLLLEQIASSDESLQELQETTDSSWLRTTVEQEAQDSAQSALAEVKNAMEVRDRVRRLVSERKRCNPPEDGVAKRVLDVLNADETVDLQEVVLALMEEGEPASSALDSALEGLVYLFRHNCVQIGVGRRRR